jgi:Stage II sporulation protein E (SpoIIE)
MRREQAVMESQFATPAALVEGLLGRADGARPRFQDWLRGPVRRLMEELKDRHRLEHTLDRMTEHALHAAEAFVRMRPAGSFEGMSVAAFRAAVLLHVAKQVAQPFGRRPEGEAPEPDPLPPCEGYECQTVFLPYEKVGSFWFGGDWYGGRVAADGALWLMVADITGHGYCAYLMANTLPSIWQACWSDGQPDDPEPSDVLGAMHDLLGDCLPDGVYAECTLARLSTDGRVTVAPAGGSRLLVYSKNAKRLDMLRLRGIWLGLDRPLAADQQTCTLEEGDELVVGTDGIFDQLIDLEGGSSGLTRLLESRLKEGDLSGAMKDVLQRALHGQKQKDDITLVMVRRRTRGA